MSNIKSSEQVSLGSDSSSDMKEVIIAALSYMLGGAVIISSSELYLAEQAVRNRKVIVSHVKDPFAIQISWKNDE